jgi:hypothetical protein
MPSTGMLRRVDLVRTNVSYERIAFIIRVIRVGELGTTQAVTGNIVLLCRVLRLLVTADVVLSSPILLALLMEAIRSSETSVVTRSTRRNIPKDGILHVNIV